MSLAKAPFLASIWPQNWTQNRCQNDNILIIFECVDDIFTYIWNSDFLRMSIAKSLFLASTWPQNNSKMNFPNLFWKPDYHNGKTLAQNCKIVVLKSSQNPFLTLPRRCWKLPTAPQEAPKAFMTPQKVSKTVFRTLPNGHTNPKSVCMSACRCLKTPNKFTHVSKTPNN